MKERKHKRKLNHVLILTSDAADANVKQFRIRAWLAEVIVIMLCILIGGVIGYFIYEAASSLEDLTVTVHGYFSRIRFLPIAPPFLLRLQKEKNY